ncbi:MAG: calcium-binding protein [Pseudomonadota bacterium]
MPDTPEVLIDPFITNTTDRAQQPKVVTLSDGRFLVAYSNVVNGEIKIRGQVFDADGTQLGQELEFEFPVDDPFDNRVFDLVAGPNNEVILVAKIDGEEPDRDVVHGVFSVSPDRADLLEFSTDGDRVLGVQSPVAASIEGRDNYRTYFVGNNFSVESVREAGSLGDTGLRPRIIERFIGNRDVELDATTLENGNVVFIIDRNGDRGNNGNIFYKIRTPDFQDGPEGETGIEGANTFDPFVAALKNGGFVIAWANEFNGGSQPIFFQLFNANGVAQTEPVRVSGPGRRKDDEPAIVALEDGGFIIFYDQDRGEQQVRGQRYDRNGERVGEDFLVANENASELDATLLPDGKVVVTYSVAGTGEIKTAILDGTPGQNTIAGTIGDDELIGTTRSDVLLGFGGADVIEGLAGNDQINGGGGADTIEGGNGNDQINGGDGNDDIEGGRGNDDIEGGRGNDDIRGFGDNDMLNGGGGADTLNGGAGNDSLTGGDGNDTFVFAGNFGDDTITDFAARNNNEKIDLTGVAGIDSFADLASALSQQGNDVLIALDGGTITLQNVNLADLNANDFLF